MASRRRTWSRAGLEIGSGDKNKKEGSGSSELWAGARRRRRECKRRPMLLASLASWWGRDAPESDKRLSSPSLAEPMAMRFGDSVAWLVVSAAPSR